jgi:16S rRNA (guanine527-N7)-methyltransferase
MYSDADEKEKIASGAKQFGVILSDHQVETIQRYINGIYEANAYINLTRVPREDAITLHVLDSLALACTLDILAGWSALDVGTGAGFPGAVLAIAFPEMKVSLLDSTRKRLRIIDSLIEELGIPNAVTIHARAEDQSLTRLHGAFDLVTARAVATTDKLAGWLLPFAGPGAYAAAYKSLDALGEVTAAAPAIERLGAKLISCERISLPDTDIVRIIALIQKTGGPGALPAKRKK